MEIRRVTRERVNQYLTFMKVVYKDNLYYRDSLSTIAKTILKGEGQICQWATIHPIMVVDRGKTVAVCTFAVVDRMADTLQLTFFEGLEHQEEAIKLIMDYGRQLATQTPGINKILIGLNLHVNYGLGLLADNFNSPPSFGGPYNPHYYLDYFSKYADEEINLVSYLTDMRNFNFNISEQVLKKITSKYQVRKADFKNLKETMAIYTSLNNQAFKNHRFYYQRKIEEDLELFGDFKILLKDENLLFLEDQGQPIGFLLWYPDFNQLIGPGESIGLKTVIKSKLLPQKVKTFKIVELAILPQYLKTGAVLGLFHKLREIVGNRYQVCETSWILEENIASRGLGIRWAHREHKHFKVFIVNLER